MTSQAIEFRLRYDRDKLRHALIEIESYRLSLNKLHLPREWKEDLQRLHIVRSVHGTTAIEGNPLTEGEVALRLQPQRGRVSSDAVHRQVANAERAFRWIEAHFRMPRNLAIGDIRTIHKLLTEGSDEADNIPGRLRAAGHNVTVGSPQLGGVHRAPAGGAETERLVSDFLTFVNSRAFRAENVVVQALIAHFYFVTLHPFGNGNGRTTRCIEAAFLLAGGYNVHGFYSLSNYFYRRRDDYFRKLQETRTTHRYDLTEFLMFGLQGFIEELERINAYVRNRTHRLQYRDMIRRCTNQRVGKRRRLLNQREADVLHALLDWTRPPDPFSAHVALQVSLDGIVAACNPLYRGKTRRTMIREFSRLANLGFIELTPMDQVQIRFDAIELY
ncbi:Adenosine monophosphate-protein transferase SoFic [Phycisphaerae bacterium RAS1]|nr:Adenosine monophosphate-protein transferase SoFic [Phycisphaerae bacterium RAS1]